MHTYNNSYCHIDEAYHQKSHLRTMQDSVDQIANAEARHSSMRFNG